MSITRSNRPSPGGFCPASNEYVKPRGRPDGNRCRSAHLNISATAQSVSPDAMPDVRDNKTAELRATLRVVLVLLPSEEKIEEKLLTVDVRRAPRGMGEDVEAAARQEAMEQAGDRVAQVVCKAKAPAR